MTLNEFIKELVKLQEQGFGENDIVLPSISVKLENLMIWKINYES